MEILDANLALLPRGHADALDHPVGARNLARHFWFTVTAHPRHSNTGALDIDATEPPGQTTVTVLVRALLGQNGALLKKKQKIC
jgi:hypothetical protein